VAEHFAGMRQRVVSGVFVEREEWAKVGAPWYLYGQKFILMLKAKAGIEGEGILPKEALAMKTGILSGMITNQKPAA